MINKGGKIYNIEDIVNIWEIVCTLEVETNRDKQDIINDLIHIHGALAPKETVSLEALTELAKKAKAMTQEHKAQPFSQRYFQKRVEDIEKRKKP